MVFKKEILDYIKPGTMVEEAFVPLVDKASFPFMSIKASGKLWIPIKTWKR